MLSPRGSQPISCAMKAAALIPLSFLGNRSCNGLCGFEFVVDYYL